MGNQTSEQHNPSSKEDTRGEHPGQHLPGKSSEQRPDEYPGQHSGEFSRSPLGLPPQKHPRQRLEEHRRQVLREPCEQLAEVPPGQLPVEHPSQILKEPLGQSLGHLSEKSPRQHPGEPRGQSSGQLQEEPPSQRQEEPPGQLLEESASQRQEELSRQLLEEPSSQHQEEPSRQLPEEPSSQRQEEPPGQLLEEPSSQRQEELSRQLLEEPSSQRQEEPPGQLPEEPSSRRQEELSEQLLEEPLSQRQKELSRQRSGEPQEPSSQHQPQEPSSQHQEEPSRQLPEEPSSQRQEEPPGQLLEEPLSQREEEPPTPRQLSEEIPGQPSGPVPEKRSKTRPERPPRKHERQRSGPFPENQSKTRPKIPPRKPKESREQLSDVAPEQPSVEPSREIPSTTPCEKTSNTGAQQTEGDALKNVETKDARHDHLLNNNWKTEENFAEKAPLATEEQNLKPVEVSFYLHVPRFHADKVTIQFSHETRKLDLEHVTKGDGDLWRITRGLNVPGNEIRYRYSVSWSEGLFSKRREETEGDQRRAEAAIQYDTFFSSTDNNNMQKENLAKSSIFYTTWLLDSITIQNIEEVLIQIEKMNFRCAHDSHLKSTVATFLKRSNKRKVTNIQRLYLCIVLGHLAYSNPDTFSLRSNKSTTNFDLLLQSFEDFSISNLLPSSSDKILKAIAPHLVLHSSRPFWLTFAAYFYQYLGVENVVNQKAIAVEKCDAKIFWELLMLLIPALKINEETQLIHRDLLKMLISTAPDCEAVSILFGTNNFAALTDKENVFLEFFQARFRNCCGKLNSGGNLVELTKVPNELLRKIHEEVYALLLDFLMSTDDPKKVHIEAFCKLATLQSCFMSKEKLEIILEILSHSNVPLLHDLMLVLLGDKSFEQQWRQVPLKNKVDHCYAWILKKLAEENGSREKDAEKIARAYQAVEQLMSCTLNDANKELAKKIFQNIVEHFKTVKRSDFFRAYKSIERCSDIVQECYKNHIVTLLRQDPSLIKTAVAEINMSVPSSSQSSGIPVLSNLIQGLLLCILEIMEIPAHKDSSGEEDDFKEMLDWCDVWLIFLNAEGSVDKLRKNKKFKEGKELWKAIASCVRNGTLTFFSDIDKHENNLSSICALVSIDHHATKNEFSKEKTKFQDCISELSQVRKDCEKKFALLKSLINYGKTVTQDTFTIHGIQELIKEFNARKKCWKTQQLAELKEVSFWGPFFHLLSPAKAIEHLTKSVSFMMVAKMCLEEKQSELKVPPAEDDEPVTTDFQWLATYLSTKVIERFQSQWNPVFRDPGFLNMVTMRTLLGSLKSEEQLQEEFTFLEKYFHQKFPPEVKVYIYDYVNLPSVLKRVKDMAALFDTFGLTDSTDSCSDSLTTFVTKLEDDSDVSLKTLHESIIEVQKIVSREFAEDVGSVVEELGRSKELVSFLKGIVDEDIRFLIDAVEEHSDQFVSESSVSDLIDVHGFLAPLIKNSEEGSDLQIFLKTLKNSCTVHKKDMAAKLRQCSTNVNSLKGLYTSVTNRGEITKEIIASALTKGVYSVALQKDDGTINATMSYVRDNNSSTTFSLSELHDHRSRAHLIVNSDRNVQLSSNEDEKEIDFADFIRQVNLFTEITTLLLKLRSSGYVKYRKFWRKMKNSNALQETKNKLQQDLEMWDNILSSARGQHYLLNYYRSDQLYVLHDFLKNRSQCNSEDVLSLIHFVDPTITKEQLEVYRKANPVSKQGGSSENPRIMISIIGNALEEIFSNTKPVMRPIVDDDQEEISFSHCKIDATVKSGELFVATLEPDSPLTANVMLTLYQNTSNAFPEPYQVLFCDPQTGWEEIHLVLQRCFFQSRQLKHDSLFCIANVELLANEVQFRLVNVIKELQNNVDGDGYLVVENADFRLALICRGGDHHHIVEQFSQYSHHIAGMSDLALSTRLKSRWPGVKMITSTLPGLGKTEKVKKEALENNMNVVTFSISGPLDQSKLIQRLKKLKLKKYHCLHLDIGEVSDPLWLDTFLFQLIVIGMVSSETQLFHLLTTHVYIEIANTLKDWLQESLVLSKYFNCIHLQWKNYDDLLVSKEITSDVQVVCQYFNAFDQGRLESEDIHFTGPQKVMSLPTNRCQELLRKHYSSEADITFTGLNTFLGVLADQLLKFSKSAFFKIANLKSMLDKEAHGVRGNLFRALLQVSKEFASRSITTWRSSHPALSLKESAEAFDKAMTSGSMSAKHMVERVEEMIQWEDSNHLLVVFHGTNSQTIAAVYRNKYFVPQNVEELLKSQVVRGKTPELEDFKVMSQLQLQEKLEKIACAKLVKKSKENFESSYILTPDNILKMILIILRVRANAPVIIMGETGCGKTSLVRYLANTCQIQFSTFNFHAGINEDEVIKFINEKQAEARESSQQIWVFLDEINTCDHLRLISDVMCHRSLLGRHLPQNLVFLAACNPYKLRPNEQIKTAGLQGKNITDECSGLVYRVRPLPESMIDYVWDYGSLAPEDEKAYIQRMVSVLPKKCENVLVSVLAESQKFIREAEKNHFCVSLRDVHRCILLIKWFQNMIIKRKELKSANNPPPTHLKKYHTMSTRYDEKPEIKSIVLALAHCYLSRLPTDELRRGYRERMMTLFSGNGTNMTREDDRVDSFSAIVRMEEEDYLDRMELPAGTARNAALRENVFVMLVCILNRIPVFVVGKPGCSKSLSIQLIHSNLRGRDSQDPLFRSLPNLYVVSYQGSESSTSDGIIKVFDKARKYKDHNKDGNVLPVVLLDEVGLAENSKYNPLKVLHSLLEPGEEKLPDVAVVGISNWSLDAAKMNRAIHLSRPEPTKEDLYETGHSLLHANAKSEGDYGQSLGSNELHCLAEAYFEYQSEQKYANFHGLRDYYSLIKSISLSESCDLQQINLALQRNFGGIHGELTNTQKIFLDKLAECMISSGEGIIPVTKLIRENLADQRARHLMLITSGDSAIGILNQNLKNLNKKEVITIFGSRFEEDLSEDYNYRILSRIILCMERDCILILRDLESIYGSLYNMLNQNYAVVGKRKNCRVALGAYSNPMCQVHDGFRCIVLTDQHKVDFSDPPFLNRFEKQLLRFTDVLNKKEKKIIAELRSWVKQVSTIQGLESQFKESDMFIGFHEDTLPSLVLFHSHGTEASNEEIIEKCKYDLMWVAAPDGVLRAQKCYPVKEDSEEISKLSDEYFQKPIHQGFSAFFKSATNGDENHFLPEDEIGSKTIVMTFSNIHTDIAKCLGSAIIHQVERLSAYKSEKQLTERVNRFWSTSEAELLVLQCKPELDGPHLLLARSIIENKRSSYQETGLKRKKHVCIVVHVQRGAKPNDIPWQFSFLCGWKQVFLDVLEAPAVALNKIRTESIQTLLMSSIWSLRKIVDDELLWCFTCIKYMRYQRHLDSILRITKTLFSSEKVYLTIEQLVLQWIKNDANAKDDEAGVYEPWQVKVACDRQALINSSTLYGAMEKHVSRLVRVPLAKIVYFLEKENAWPPHIHVCEDDAIKSEYEDIWRNLLLNDAIFDASEIPTPLGAEFYNLDSFCLDLLLPFSHVLMGRVDGVKELFLEDYAQIQENANENNSGQLTEEARMQQIKRYSEIVLSTVPEINAFSISCCDSYMDDLFDIVTADFSTRIKRHHRVSIVKATFMSHVKVNLQVKDVVFFYMQLHTFVWIHKEQILDQLRMVDCCQPFVNRQVLTSLTDEFLLRHENVAKQKNKESMDCSEDESTRSQNGEDDVAKNESSEVESKEFESEGNEQNKKNKQTKNNESEEDVIEERIDSGDEESGGDHKCFEEMLVTVYCEAMLPSQETVEKRNGDLKSWIRNASLLLSLAFKISDQSPAFHFLRLCVDFAKIFLVSPTHTGKAAYSLHILNVIGDDLRPGYLNTDKSFQKITEYLIKPLEEQAKKEAIKYKALQKFSALFFGRCIDTNVDTCGARPIVEQVLSLDRADLVLMMGPVIQHLLVVEEIASPGIFVDIITNPSKIEKCPCLQNIDQVFKDLFADEDIHHDSYAPVIICDIIQSLLKFDDKYSMEDIDSSDHELLTSVNGAIQVLSESTKNCGLVVLSAVAFLRVFFTMLSRFVVENPNVTKEESQYSLVMNEVNSLLSAPATGDARRLSLQFFFLKQLYGYKSLFDLRKLCRESEMLPCIKSAVCGNVQTSDNKAVFVSACKLPEYQQVKAAYWNLTEEDETGMLTILGLCQNNPNICLAVMGVLVNMMYLKRAVKKLTYKEERFADWFSKNVDHFPPPLKELLLKIIGKKEFHCPQLQLSPESSVDEVETALLILHVTCVVVSGVYGKHSLLYQYFANPQKCKNTFILANGQNRIHQAFKIRQPDNGPSPCSCSCGLRIAFENIGEDDRCPSCTESVNRPVEPEKTNNSGTDSTKGYSPVPANELSQWDILMEDMNPAVFRALHLIVHASLYAGVAVQISTETKLASLLNLEEAQNSKTGVQDPAEFCFDHVTTDLSSLVTILQCRKEIAFKVMHLVVENCTDLIRSNTTCLTLKQRSGWEFEFSKLTQGIFRETLGSSKGLKEQMRMQQTSEIEECTIEDKIWELDEYPSEPSQQNRHLKRLFRVTRHPTFIQFRATFVSSSKVVQDNHSFLSLFFARFDELPIIRNLYHLLKWARLVSSALTHRISRKDAELKSIDDFIHGHVLEQHKSHEEIEKQERLFNKFKKAWNTLRPSVIQKLDEKETKMPRLTKTDHIAYCLTESDSGIYLLTAFRILISLQNSFLDEVLSLSASQKHSALRFLEKDGRCSGISSISIQQAKEKEIIDFKFIDVKWSDKFFKYAQNNPEYGHGEEIFYDFERIELELAGNLVFGKCYLTESLNRFIFAKELFHSCAPLLTEIRSLFPQSPCLPEEVHQGLTSLKAGRIKEAQDLLQHIEVLIYILKLKLKMKTFQKDMPLETFVDNWLSMLPSAFPVALLPQPSSSIKLKHITALYEALEDLLADAAIEGLPDQFRDDLTQETKDKLSSLVDKDDGFKLQTFLNALRRFVFRYLSSEKFLPDKNTTLNASLKEPSLWSPAQPPDPQVIPKELTLQHITAVVTHLQELEKKRKGNSKRPKTRQFLPENRVVSTSQAQAGRNTRRISSYSYF